MLRHKNYPKPLFLNVLLHLSIELGNRRSQSSLQSYKITSHLNNLFRTLFQAEVHQNVIFFPGTIIATLTRKSKSMELLTKEEMITYHKGNNIPTSHIQLHDPDSVTAAVSIFRVSIDNYNMGLTSQLF